MPGISGFDVLDALKGDVATKDIPVVICTSRVLTGYRKVTINGKAVAILEQGRAGTPADR